MYLHSATGRNTAKQALKFILPLLVLPLRSRAAPGLRIALSCGLRGTVQACTERPSLYRASPWGSAEQRDGDAG